MSERNLKLTIEYDGTDFQGWQRQAPPSRTVQQVLEEAFWRVTKERRTIQGAGRTDSGVHARAQVASVRTHSAIPTEAFPRALNASLPRDVAVVAVEEMDDTFDARRSARGKHYAYRIWNREARSPLQARTSWHVRHPLDLDAMRAAAAHLLGEHDFTSFRAADCDRKNPVRILRRLDVTRPEPHLVLLDLEATAFLKHMARIIVGTLVEVGLGGRPADDVARVLWARDRTQAGRTAPANGLTLERVLYDTPPRPVG